MFFSRIDSPGHYQDVRGPNVQFRGVAFGGPNSIKQVQLSFRSGENLERSHHRTTPLPLVMGGLELSTARYAGRQEHGLRSRCRYHRHRANLSNHPSPTQRRHGPAQHRGERVQGLTHIVRQSYGKSEFRAYFMTERRMTQKAPEYGDVEILLGDNRDILPQLETGSIQCCVTSPPYWGLRDYDHSAQIGTESSPEEYVENLVGIFREVRRVLADDGIFWLNVGDGYARNGGTGNCGPNAQVGNTKKLIQRRNCTVPDCWGLKDRDLMGLPWRVAFALQADGWLLRSKVTWVKKAPMPESVKNRPLKRD